MKRILIVVVIAVGLGVSLANGDVVQRRFEQLDKNGDKRLSADELSAARWLLRWDADGDGEVTLDEVKQGMEPLLGRLNGSRGEAAALPSTPDEEMEASWVEGATILNSAENGVGRRIADVQLVDHNGQEVSLHDHSGQQGLVVGLFTTACPISRKLGPEMKRQESALKAKGFGVVWVCAFPGATSESVREFGEDFGLQAKILRDPDQRWISTMESETTTEVAVLDAGKTLVYRGAIHDQYGLGYSKDKATRFFLDEAVEAVLEGRRPFVGATRAPGCALDRREEKMAKVDSVAITYHDQVARILQNHCVECHRQDGIGPFRLDTLESVLEHAGMIRKQVERGAMPPWFAAEHPEQEEALFVNDNSLSPTDKEALLTWLTSDRPVGDPKLAPVPLKTKKEWSIGTPDLVLSMPRAIQVKAEGAMPYQNVVIETSLQEDRWVSSYEIQPSARQVVHHVIVRVHRPGERVQFLGEGDGFWAAYVPGNSHRILPEGSARFLPAGARLSLQIHYTPIGKAVEDRTRIGLIFAEQPPEHEVRVTAFAKPRLRIPAGAADHVESTQRKLSSDYTITGFMPHLHTRGKSFRYEVRYPDGRTEVLLDVPRYDFNWQLQYTYAHPKWVPAGSTLIVTAVYDNSTGNSANPDPTKTVRWGPQTWDEMLIGYVEHQVTRR